LTRIVSDISSREPQVASEARDLRRATPASLRLFDRVSGSILVFAAAVLLWRTHAHGENQFFGDLRVAYIAFSLIGICGLMLLFFYRRIPIGPLGHAVRACAYVGGIVLGAGVLSRVLKEPVPTPNPAIWTPDAAPFTRISADDRVRWALRIALHRMTAGDRDNLPLTVPADWPFPKDVEIATVVRSAHIGQVTARIVGTQRICAMSTARAGEASPPVHFHPTCADASVADSSLHFYRPQRGALPRVDPRPADHGSSWPQYRLDAGNTATIGGGSGGVAWSANLRGAARSTPSVADDIVLIGGHGTGSLEAFSLATGALRWWAYLPNWVHQDVVSDGSIAAVGFGDNEAGLRGASPSGVAAYDLGSGRLLWTAFERNSVMTSPVIVGNEVSYITEAGLLQIRDLRDGRLRRTLLLPGNATMAPPAVRRDTLIVSLDANHICVVDLSRAAQLWCTTIRRGLMFGHSAPSLIGKTVVVSGRVRVETDRMPLLSELRRLLLRLLDLHSSEPDAGQQVFGLDLADGSVLWRSDVFRPRPHENGQISGTAVADGARLLVTLPIADKLVALDRSTGRLLWSVDGGGSRGPVLVNSGLVYRTTRDGRLQSLRSSDGHLLCSVQLPQHFDRAGPILAAGSLIVASLEARLTSIPKRFVDSCDAGRIQGEFKTPPLPNSTVK
jgi:outer membrane protein assembly factor BamB